MPKETTDEMLNRISREIAQLGSGELIPISRVVVERGVRVLKYELYRRVNDPDDSDEEERAPSDSATDDERSDDAPHNID